MLKKILTILIVLILIVILGFVVFWLVNKENTENAGNKLSIRDFLPFGRTPSSDNIENEILPPIEENDDNVFQKTQKLNKISESPIAGAFVFSQSGKILIRFVDKATGHIFETSADDQTPQKISNTTMPKIQEVVWAGSDKVILRFLKEDEETIESVLLKLVRPENATLGFEFLKDLKKGDMGVDVLNLQKTLNLDSDTKVASSGAGSSGRETSKFGPATENAVKKFQQKFTSEILEPQNTTTPSGVVDSFTREKLNEITGVKKERLSVEDGGNLYQVILSYLPTDIKTLAYLSTLDKIFYILEDAFGSLGVLSDTDGSRDSEIFDSPAREWLVKGHKESVALQTKATAEFPGLLLSIDSKGNLKKLLGGISGLTALLSPEKDKILISGSIKNSFELYLYDVKNGEIKKFNIKTLPEKCVWSVSEQNSIFCAVPKSVPKSDYPDGWYQGEISWNDALWKINTESMLASLVYDFNTDIDAIELALSPSEQFLIFTNKKDLSLWSFELSE